MNYSTAVMLINPAIRAVKTIYEPEGSTNKAKQQRYTFKTLDPELEIGDYVLVPTDTRFGFTVNEVVEVDVGVDYDSNIELKWIASRIDFAKYNEILKMEEAAINLIKAGELRKRREEIKKNTLDAVSEGELNALDIAKLGTTVLEYKTQA